MNTSLVTNIFSIAISTLFVVVMMGQGFVILSLVHVVRDLEKLTGRKADRNGYTFQFNVRFGLAMWFALMAGMIWVNREVNFNYQERQFREMERKVDRVDSLDRDLKELKVQLAELQGPPMARPKI